MTGSESALGRTPSLLPCQRCAETAKELVEAVVGEFNVRQVLGMLTQSGALTELATYREAASAATVRTELAQREWRTHRLSHGELG